MSRSFLILQGPIGSFFAKLAERLKAEGCSVLKINFNGGDKFFYNKLEAIDFTLGPAEWGDYVRHIAKIRKITDLIVYSDSRELHKIAIKELKEIGVRIHVFEEGYFRPSWITLEENGVNHNSSLPRDPEFYKAQEAHPPQPILCKSHFVLAAKYAMEYYSASFPGIFGKFEKYNHHFGCSPHKTMYSWMIRVMCYVPRAIIAKQREKDVANKPYFLVVLQLSRDSQIKEHSDFSCMRDYIKFVISNFARNANKADYLVIKNHPLDNGVEDLESYADKIAGEEGVTDRVVFVDGGHLSTLIERSKAAITVNSTSGLSVISRHKPLKVLGRAIYNMEGLTCQNSLEDFWYNQTLPNNDLYKKFKNYVIEKTLINGNFYTKKGVELAIKNSLGKLLSDKDNDKIRNFKN